MGISRCRQNAHAGKTGYISQKKKGMFFLGFLILLVVLVLLVVAIGINPKKLSYDFTAPLNLFLFQEPAASYSDQLVNLWVKKTWRTDGRRIPCRLETATKNLEKFLIIYSHGNAENLLTCSQFIRELSEQTQMDVLAWDYSGYGLNEGDAFERSPEGINLSLQTIVDHMTDQHGHGYSIDRILFWGYSLGTGPSTHAAAGLCSTGHKPAGLVLVGAYASILDVVKDQTNEQVSAWFTERWSTKDVIASVTVPILLLHGQSDGLINVQHAHVLHERNPRAKEVVLPNTGHTKFHWGECVKAVKLWLTNEEIVSNRF